jgi:hypothetical protein
MIGYHCTTAKKLSRYKQTGCILPPVRFWPNEFCAQQWMKRVGRDVLLQIKVEESYPLPDHKPARWTQECIRQWEEVSI